MPHTHHTNQKEKKMYRTRPLRVDHIRVWLCVNTSLFARILHAFNIYLHEICGACSQFVAQIRDFHLSIEKSTFRSQFDVIFSFFVSENEDERLPHKAMAYYFFLRGCMIQLIPYFWRHHRLKWSNFVCFTHFMNAIGLSIRVSRNAPCWNVWLREITENLW